MSCKLCERNTDGSDFCHFHLLASKNLKDKYTQWAEAYGNLAWRDYLEMILKLSETGRWVREVAELEVKLLESKKGQQVGGA